MSEIRQQFWNRDGVLYEDMSLTPEVQDIIDYYESLEIPKYDFALEKQIRDICASSLKGFPVVLKAKKNIHLWEYVLSCTQLLSFCEKKFRIHYAVSTRVNWCLNHIQMFPQCHNEKCSDKLLYKIRSVGVFESYVLFCSNKSRCMNQSSLHKIHVQQTLLKNYGVPIPSKSPIILQRMKDTCLKNFGCENAFQKPEVIRSSQSPEAKAKKLNSLSSHMLQKFGVPFYVMTDEFKKKAQISDGQSAEEHELAAFVRSVFSGEVKIGTFEELDFKRQLDIFIPSLRLAFEFNGIFYHSVSRDSNNYMYHLEKTKICEEKNIKLVHIWEDEWYDDNDKCKSLVQRFIEGRADPINLESVQNKQDIIEVDRSKFCKLFSVSGYKLIGETLPKVIMRSKQNKDKYLVADCGNLIYQKIS